MKLRARFLTLTTTLFILYGTAYGVSHKVYIFLSETCPVSQYYTLSLRALHQQYQAQNIDFIGIFPNRLSTAGTIDAFKNKYHLPFTCIRDSLQTTVNRLGATITPEVAVVDTSGTLLYRGRIDNAFAQLGKRRRVVTHHELSDLLQSLSDGRPIQTQHTKAIGCLITKSQEN